MGNIVTSEKKGKKEKACKMTLQILTMLLTITIMIPEGTILSTSTTKTIVFAEATTPLPLLMISSSDPRDFRIHALLNLRSGGTVIDDDDNNGRDDNASPFSLLFLSFTTVISSTRLQNSMQWKQQLSSSGRHDMSFFTKSTQRRRERIKITNEDIITTIFLWRARNIRVSTKEIVNTRTLNGFKEIL